VGVDGPGLSDLFVSGRLMAPTTFTTVPSLPEHGSTVYARLFSNVYGVIEYNDYTYTETAP
jgi:hypothetical protein